MTELDENGRLVASGGVARLMVGIGWPWRSPEELWSVEAGPAGGTTCDIEVDPGRRTKWERQYYRKRQLEATSGAMPSAVADDCGAGDGEER